MTIYFQHPERYLEIARRDIGVREIKGPRHHTRIVQMLARVKAWWRDDETPWCGVALADWMLQAGHPIPKHYYRALAWADYGVPCRGVALGAVAVMARKGGGHVGLVTGVSADGAYVLLLGGNQNDSVCEAWFPISRITHYRLPPGVAPISAPVRQRSVAALSTSEA